MSPARWRTTGKRRRAILEAAARLFLERGEEQLTIAEVAAESAASVGSIYHHFKSKEHLLAGLVGEVLAGYRDELQAKLDKVEGAEELVKTIVRHHLLWIHHHRHMARLLHQARRSPHLGGSQERIKEGTAQFLRGVKERFLPHIEAGELRRFPLPLFQAILIGPAHELARNVLSGRTADLDLEAAAETLAEAAWRAVRV